MILGIVLKASDQPLELGCEVEACAKYVAYDSDFTFCFNGLVESLACLVMKTLQVHTAAANYKRLKSAKKLI